MKHDCEYEECSCTNPLFEFCECCLEGECNCKHCTCCETEDSEEDDE